MNSPTPKYLVWMVNKVFYSLQRQDPAFRVTEERSFHDAELQRQRHILDGRVREERHIFDARVTEATTGM